MISTDKTTEKKTVEKLRLTGMDCGDCALSIEKSLRQMPGVEAASVNFGASTAEVRYDASAITRDAVVRRIADLGYGVAQATPRAGSMSFIIEGMDCGDCARTIEKAVAAMPSVRSASVNFGSARLTVTPEQGTGAQIETEIAHKVREAGYRITPLQQRAGGEQRPFWREPRALTTAAGTILALTGLVLSFLPVSPMSANAFFASTIAVSGFGFARAGLLAARSGRADMNLLMSVAAVGAAALGDWGEAATVVLLFAIGGTLQAYTLDKTRGAIRGLMDLSPATALVRRVDKSSGLPVMRDMRLAVEDVEPGETVLVGPGERLPLDGVVSTGSSTIDQSPITGESVPVDVQKGAEVFAGTINGHGAFSMRTSRASGDTTLANIINMVEEAQSQRAPSQQFVERFSAIYTPLVIVSALLVAIGPPLLLGQSFTEWFYRALVLLVVACPCALVISTPVSIVAAIGAATRHGVLIKGGATLEALGRVRAVAFDKTGTLTEGRPRVVSVEAIDGDEQKLLALAAAVEARSEHPLARAIVHAARGNRNGAGQLEVESFTALPGLGARAEIGGESVYVGNPRLFKEQGIPLDGVSGALDRLHEQGDTAVLVGTSKGILGVFGLADKPRADAKEAIQLLHRAGVARIAMLTGDNSRTAGSVASELGVDEYFAELLPAEKVSAVKELEAKYGPIAMVGDGVNDAPALAVSQVGIAMGVSGTDAALQVAGVALMSDNLLRLDYAVLLSRKTLQVVKQNITVSILVKVVALGLAIIGALPLWGAIMSDMGVSLLVTLNGMRLLAFRGR